MATCTTSTIALHLTTTLPMMLVMTMTVLTLPMVMTMTMLMMPPSSPPLIIFLLLLMILPKRFHIRNGTIPESHFFNYLAAFFVAFQILFTHVTYINAVQKSHFHAASHLLKVASHTYKMQLFPFSL
jgi:ATP/ADP translocase